mmetsp:Transcript_40352/g.41162  ORF Transcript_40352/g.41162 Transcript_40352/m.41162 type:complete len:267 (+) Transcript_40352:279-1079(+)
MVLGYGLQSEIERSVDLNQWPVIITGILVAFSMGMQAGAASNVYTSFPNTTGMTASVASTFAAGSTLLLMYMRLFGISSFYLSYHESLSLSLSSSERERESDRVIESSRTAESRIGLFTDIERERERKIENKMITDRLPDAWDEFSKQSWPLISFTSGAFAGAACGHRWKFWSLSIPIFIICFIMTEIYIQRIKNIRDKNESEKKELTREERDRERERETILSIYGDIYCLTYLTGVCVCERERERKREETRASCAQTTQQYKSLV